jgi:hypothetical protein
MAYMDEIEVGDRVTVHDRRTVFIEPGTVEAFGRTKRAALAARSVSVWTQAACQGSSWHVTLQVGEES